VTTHGILDPISNLPDSVEGFVRPEKKYDWLDEEEDE
jgi:hypothetical protein